MNFKNCHYKFSYNKIKIRNLHIKLKRINIYLKWLKFLLYANHSKNRSRTSLIVKSFNLLTQIIVTNNILKKRNHKISLNQINFDDLTELEEIGMYMLVIIFEVDHYI